MNDGLQQANDAATVEELLGLLISILSVRKAATARHSTRCSITAGSGI